MKTLAVIAIFLPLFALSGCGSSRLECYPDFLKGKNTLGEITILADCMFIDALMGDTSEIDVPENSEMGLEVLQQCAEKLRIKGYKVGNTVLSSIGLLMNQNQLYKIVRSADERHTDKNDLSLQHAPFYLDQQVAKDSSLQLTLAYVYSSLINSKQKQDTFRTIIPEAVGIGKAVGSATIMVVLVGGMNIPAGKGTTTVNTGFTRDVVGMQQVSQVSARFYFINTKNGELIWDDRKFRQGGIVYPDKVNSMIGSMLDELP